ncbi:hypothetical protein NE865_04370 [Phthorimaea operculella]|nr:hypothetical protein NE865_04370 [Phthorimaea operculella]
MINLFRVNLPSRLVCRSSKALSSIRGRARAFADTPHTDLTTSKTSKQLITTENDSKVRVRRARSSDVPRVMRFVRENSRVAWPSLVSTPVSPTSTSQLVLADYVARALSQGHTMMAEQVATRRGWLTVRGLALGSAVCPWDATMLEKWARCIKDQRSRHLVNLAATCLRGPGLHDKYHVHNILQVILIIPPESQNCSEIVQMLAKSAIQRGKEVGFPLLRFDATSEPVAKALEDMKLQREWILLCNLLHVADTITENSVNKEASKQADETTSAKELPDKGNFVAVYSASTSDPLPAPAQKTDDKNTEKENKT